jgi:hypothetical protein
MFAVLFSFQELESVVEQGSFACARKRMDELMFVNANLNSLHTLKYERSLISARSNEKCPVYSLRRISEIFCGLSFEVFGPPSQSDVCLSRPLSKARQMTSIPVAAANDDHTRGPLGDEELNVIRATKYPTHT